MSATTREISAWLAAEWPKAGPHRRAQLLHLAEHLKHADRHIPAGALPVGGFQRQLALRHERKLAREAMHLGFHPPEEAVKEMGLHAVGRSLGLSL